MAPDPYHRGLYGVAWESTTTWSGRCWIATRLTREQCEENRNRRLGRGKAYGVPIQRYPATESPRAVLILNDAAEAEARLREVEEWPAVNALVRPFRYRFDPDDECCPELLVEREEPHLAEEGDDIASRLYACLDWAEAEDPAFLYC